VTVAGCGTTPDSPAGVPSSDGGTTVTYALAPTAAINYIFPFVPAVSGDYSVYNANDFQQLMYRPLYWFGLGTKPLLNPSLSLAFEPVYHGQQVTIKLKPGWKWSDGEPVDAQDVMFWMNMLRAERTSWAAYVPGYFPDNVSDVRAVGTDEIQMTISGAYSETWFTDNELSQITPMPMAWDVTSLTGAPGSGGCSTASYTSISINPTTFAPVSASARACAAVFDFLSRQSGFNPTDTKNPAAGASPVTSFGKNPLWQVVDGPWKVQSVTAAGGATLVINDKYSLAGTLPADHITRFVELPFTSEQAEYDVLQDPTSGQAVDVGYLPTVDAPPPVGSGAGANPDTMSDYNMTEQYAWLLSYFPYNFKNPTVGAIFDQQYFRQAFQDLVDQEGVIDGPLHGYGKVTIGPVGDYPVTPYLSNHLRQVGDQWPLSISGAIAILKSRGWSVTPGGTDTCTRPGTGSSDCGAGIRAGTPLNLTLMYATGTDWMESAVKELASNAALAGIQLKVIADSFGTVAADVSGLNGPGAWEMGFFGAWTYSPDYVPTGEELFLTGAVANFGQYSNPTNNADIVATLRARTPAEFKTAMDNWEDFLANQLPVVYEPDVPTLIETIKGLDIGVQNSALTITPEDWHWQFQK
jgi:peptide/nickel transport system substrate-binding protein